MAVWAKIVAVFREKNWGGFWRVLAPKVAVSDFEVLKTLKAPAESNRAARTPSMKLKSKEY